MLGAMGVGKWNTTMYDDAIMVRIVVSWISCETLPDNFPLAAADTATIRANSLACPSRYDISRENSFSSPIMQSSFFR